MVVKGDVGISCMDCCRRKVVIERWGDEVLHDECELNGGARESLSHGEAYTTCQMLSEYGKAPSNYGSLTFFIADKSSDFNGNRLNSDEARHFCSEFCLPNGSYTCGSISRAAREQKKERKLVPVAEKRIREIVREEIRKRA